MLTSLRERPTGHYSGVQPLVIIVLAFALVGCASGPDIPREVAVQVPVPCIAERPARPSLLSDAELLALDDYGLIVALARDRRVRTGYQAVLEAALAGCR